MAPQGRYWLLTVPATDWNSNCLFVGEPTTGGGDDAVDGGRTGRLPDGVTYIAGQREIGEQTGYEHWQLVVYFRKKVRLARVKELFGQSVHAELTRSQSAREYVFKETTSVEGTRFELGTLPFRRGETTDWAEQVALAKAGRLNDLEPELLVRYYGNFRRIASDFGVCLGIEKTVYAFIGPTETGKSRRAWAEAGVDAYPKAPTSKFWDGYRGQRHVVIDEFRGAIDISHLLRWFDRYPLFVEIKGSSTPLSAEKIWITSNLDVYQWYPTLDQETLDALKRRLVIEYF